MEWLNKAFLYTCLDLFIILWYQQLCPSSCVDAVWREWCITCLHSDAAIQLTVRPSPSRLHSFMCWVCFLVFSLLVPPAVHKQKNTNTCRLCDKRSYYSSSHAILNNISIFHPISKHAYPNGRRLHFNTSNNHGEKQKCIRTWTQKKTLNILRLRTHVNYIIFKKISFSMIINIWLFVRNSANFVSIYLWKNQQIILQKVKFEQIKWKRVNVTILT